MPKPAPTPSSPAGDLLDDHLAAQLPTFETFFKTVGFKRLHGRIWGLLVLAGRPLSSREISAALSLSQGATSTALAELTEWGAITSEFDSARRCHLHSPVSNTLSIAATVIRRREQVIFSQFRQAAARTLAYVTQRYGERDPRVLTLRSIISTCEIAEAVMQLVVGAVAGALDDSESILHKAISTALKVGVVLPSRLLLGKGGLHSLAAQAAAAQAQVLAEGMDAPSDLPSLVDADPGERSGERLQPSSARSDRAVERGAPAKGARAEPRRA